MLQEAVLSQALQCQQAECATAYDVQHSAQHADPVHLPRVMLAEQNKPI